MALVVADHRKVGLDNLSAEGLEVGPGSLPQRHDGEPGLNRVVRDVIGIDIQAGNGDAFAAKGIRIFNVWIRGRAKFRGGRSHYPRLNAPEVASNNGVIRDHDIKHSQHVVHGAGVGNHDVHRGNQGPVTACRDDPSRRGVGAEPIVGCGCAARGPGFLAQAKSGETGAGCGARAVGGSRAESRGQEVGVIRAFGTTIDATLHAPVCHRRHVCEPQQNSSRLAQLPNSKGVIRSDEVGKGWRPSRHRQPFSLVTILRAVRNAVEGAECLPARSTLVGSPSLVKYRGAHNGDGIEGDAVTVKKRDAVEVSGHEFDAGDVSRVERPL